MSEQVDAGFGSWLANRAGEERMKNYGLHIQKQAKELTQWFHNYLAYSSYPNIEKQRKAVIRRIAKMRKLLDELEKDMQS